MHNIDAVLYQLLYCTKYVVLHEYYDKIRYYKHKIRECGMVGYTGFAFETLVRQPAPTW